jgi:hypothetical protein
MPGFYIETVSKNCLPCGINAKTCTNSYTPITCNTGYSLVNSACLRCPAGATACTSSSAATAC